MPGEGSSHVCESEFGGVLGSVSSDWGVVQVLGINPGNGGGGHAEVKMIGHRIGVAGLGMSAADLLLDLSETGLDFPARGVVFHDLFDAEREVGGHQRDPLALAVHPHDVRAATQGLERHDPLGGQHLAQGAVHVHGVDLGLFAQCRGHVCRAAKTFAVFPRSSRATRDRLGDGVEDGIAAQARKQVGASAQAFAQRLESATNNVANHRVRWGLRVARACLAPGFTGTVDAGIALVIDIVTDGEPQP